MSHSPSVYRPRDTVDSVIAGHAQRRPDEPFLVFEREPGVVERTTWRELHTRVHATACALARRGVRPGDRIGVHLTNCPDFYDIWFAAAMLGAAIVPTNPLATPTELSYLYAHSQCRLVLTQPDLIDAVQQTGTASVVNVRDEWVVEGDVYEAPHPSNPSTVLGVLYTSGTTSHPKGVLITHAAYLNAGDTVAAHLRLRSDDRQLVVLPLFHGNAQFYSTMSAVVTGASIGLTPTFSASRWSRQAVTLDATVASLFAAPIRMILAHAGQPEDDAHRLRAVLYAQNITAQQQDRFEDRFSAPLIQLYGMTETVAPATLSPLFEDRRSMSMGRALPSIPLRVVDPTGRDVEANEVGELLVGGEPGRTLMTGYLDNAEQTAEALRDGWLHTGDLVYADADGYFYFTDRAKDMIKRAGENVSCSEVERVVDNHPDVIESAARAFQDDIRDEALVMFTVLKPGATLTEQQLLDYCRTHMAKFKVPDSVEFIDALPRTSVGKIQKHLLRRRAAAVETN